MIDMSTKSAEERSQRSDEKKRSRHHPAALASKSNIGGDDPVDAAVVTQHIFAMHEGGRIQDWQYPELISPTHPPLLLPFLMWRWRSARGGEGGAAPGCANSQVANSHREPPLN